MRTKNTNGHIRTLKCAPDLMTTGECAKRLGVAPRTVAKMIDRGQLKGFRIPGSEDRRVHRRDFNAMCRSIGHTSAICTTEAGPDPMIVLALGCDVIEPDSLRVVSVRHIFTAGWMAAEFRPIIILAPIELGRLELVGIAESVREIDGYAPTLIVVGDGDAFAGGVYPGDPSFELMRRPVHGADLLALLAAR